MSEEQAKKHKMGTRIREWRKERNLKGYELAKIIKISQGSLSDIENNKSCPSAVTLHNLRVYTNIDIIWVLTGDYSLPEEREKVFTAPAADCPKCSKIERIIDLVKNALEK